MHYDFIEIGTGDFETEVQSCDENARGICVEPLKYYLDKLPRKPNVTYVNAAISDCAGFISCFYIPEHLIEEYKLPWWLRGCSSIGNYHPTAKRIVTENKLNPNYVFKNVVVPLISVNELFKTYDVTSIKNLKIDTEGHDCIILRSVINCIQVNKIQIEQIKFESNVLSNAGEVDSVIMSLQKLGYKLLSRGEDTILKNFTCK